MDAQKMSSKCSSTCSYLTNTKPVWTPQGHAKDVLKGIVYQFLFDWHNTCLNTPWTSKWCLKWILYKFQFGCSKPIGTPHGRANDVLKLIVCQSYLSVATIFEHRMDVQKMSSKRSSTSSYLTDTPVWTPMDVQMMSWSSTTIWVPQPYWTPLGPKDVLKVIVYQFLFDWHNICLNTPWTSKWCPQRDPLQVPIWVSQPYLNTPWTKRCPQNDRLSSYLTNTKPVSRTCKRCPQRDRLPVPIWLTQHLFEHPMDVQMMSSKGSSTSSYLSVPTLFEHPMDVQMMSSKWSSTSSYLTFTTPIWTPHGRPKDVLKGIRLQVPIWVSQTLFEHPMDVQKMSSKWSSTCSYLTNTKPVWTPQGHAKDVLKGIVYQFLFDWHNTCLNTPLNTKGMDVEQWTCQMM